MKSTLVLAAVLGLTFGAPAENISSEIQAEVQRKERSFGPLPCGGAGGYGGVGGFGPAPTQYLPQIPQALPQRPLPQYREHEKHQESNNARSYYEPSLPALPAASGGSASATASVLGPAPSPAPSSGGSAVGLFPNAKVGGCNVPLLLSCSPQVVTGHIAESHYAAPAYRHTEEPKRAMRNAELSNARVTSHHKVSEDYPEPKDPHPGNHHTVSEDFPEPNLTVYVPQQQETKKELQNIE